MGNGVLMSAKDSFKLTIIGKYVSSKFFKDETANYRFINLLAHSITCFVAVKLDSRSSLEYSITLPS